MKKQFSIPLVFLADAPAVTDFGAGSLGGGTTPDDPTRLRPVPMSFGEWASSRWCADYDNSGDVTMDDYAKWWSTAGLGETAWMQFNPGVSMNTDK